MPAAAAVDAVVAEEPVQAVAAAADLVAIPD